VTPEILRKEEYTEEADKRTPKIYVDLTKLEDKGKRPSADKICGTLSNWINDEDAEKTTLESSVILETVNLTDTTQQGQINR
ncbi:23444_t:CDS:2, partial [Gigaspora margarita]